MYLDYWNLKQPPFRVTGDRRALFESATFDEAQARLRFLIDGRRQVGLLLGPAGTGKSLLLQMLSEQLATPEHQTLIVSLQGLDKDDLVWALATSWGVDPSQRPTSAESWLGVENRLRENALLRLHTTVLFDDADAATTEVLSQVARLVQVASSPTIAGELAQAATLVLAARSERVARLGDRLLELADLRIDLAPWTAEETRAFVDRALLQSGRHEPTFSDDALSLLARLSHGIPRHVAQLADLALVAAAGQQASLVDAHIVRTVHDELCVVHSHVEIC